MLSTCASSGESATRGYLSFHQTCPQRWADRQVPLPAGPSRGGFRCVGVAAVPPGMDGADSGQHCHRPGRANRPRPHALPAARDREGESHFMGTATAAPLGAAGQAARGISAPRPSRLRTGWRRGSVGQTSMACRNLPLNWSIGRLATPGALGPFVGPATPTSLHKTPFTCLFIRPSVGAIRPKRSEGVQPHHLFFNNTGQMHLPPHGLLTISRS